MVDNNDINMNLTKTFLEKTTLLSKCRGSMVGAVVGDCLGAHFEMSWDIKPETVNRFVTKLQERGEGKYHPSWSFLIAVSSNFQKQHNMVCFLMSKLMSEKNHSHSNFIFVFDTLGVRERFKMSGFRSIYREWRHVLINLMLKCRLRRVYIKTGKHIC